MSRRFRYCALAAIALALLGGAGARAAGPLEPDLIPNPGLEPAQVVRIQLEALKRNDADDRGIAVAFEFASPDNRASTGPLPRFAQMIKNGPYALMLRFTSASYEPVEVEGDRAVQKVTLVAPGEAPVTYVFYLSRQAGDGRYQDCWMTDGVQAFPAAAVAA